MQKIIVSTLLLFAISILANDNYELKLYEKILPLIFKEIPIKIFTDEKTAKLLEQSDRFKITTDCNTTDVIIGKNFDNLPNSCKNKPLFSTSYRWYKNYDNSFGAFYWRKGRPQLKFKRERLEKLNILLPDTLQKYIK